MPSKHITSKDPVNVEKNPNVHHPKLGSIVDRLAEKMGESPNHTDEVSLKKIKIEDVHDMKTPLTLKFK